MTGQFAPHVLFGLDAMMVSTIILCITYAAIIWDKLNRAVVALIGASAMVAIGALDQDDLGYHVGASERGGAEHGRADLRQPAVRLRGRELRHNGAYAVMGRALTASVAQIGHGPNLRSFAALA